MNERRIPGILKLPMEDQLRHADEEGMTHEEWVAKTQANSDKMEAFAEEIIAFEREAEEKGLPVNETFQARIDSGNPV